MDSVGYVAEFELGDIVYLKTDTENSPRTVTEITFSIDGGTRYSVVQSTRESTHYALELSKERNLGLGRFDSGNIAIWD